MYVKVLRQEGQPLLINLEGDVRRFDCSNADVIKAVTDHVPLCTTCACCERRLVVINVDDDVIPPVATAYLKGGRSH